MGRSLLDQLCRALAAGEETPVTPLVRQGLHLAALLELDFYHALFQLHLDGFDTKRPSEPVTDDADGRVRKAFIHDRISREGKVQGLQLSVLETLHSRSVKHREEVVNTSLINQEYDLREAIQRIRSRVGRFAVDAEKVLATATNAKPKAFSMTVASDASLVVRMLAEFETEPGDADRGRHNLTQHGVATTLASKWETEMSPARINDAIDILEANGYVKAQRGPGTTPYKFSGVTLTPAGRLEYERAMGETKASNKSGTVRQGGTKIFFGHGHSPIWKEFRDYVRDRLDLEWDEFNREATAGYTTKERLDQMLDHAAFAFLVMTAEDQLADGTKVARGNVIHEVGLFQGRLGFRKAIVLLENGCDQFSNIHGITQIRFDSANTAAKFDEIRQTLEREGILKK